MDAAEPPLRRFWIVLPLCGAQERRRDRDRGGHLWFDRTQELEQFAGEINAIANEAQPESIRVIYCDAAVQAEEEFGPAEPIKLSPKGGGGTDFVPAFKWVEENGIEPKCLIYLTDLCCNSFPPTPDYPVLGSPNPRRPLLSAKHCESGWLVESLHP